MEDKFQIWVDRLKTGKTQKINESFDPAFLDVQESELKLDTPVIVKGEAYLTENELILRMKSSTKIKMPCAICNQMIEIPLSIEDFYHTEALDEVPSGIFNYKEALREALLIELPRYVECKGGNCPARETITPYMRSNPKIQENTHLPFSNLDS